MGELEDAAVHPGTPDGFERLWTPHRMVYIQGENKPASPDQQECPFCAVQSREDREGLIVHRGASAPACGATLVGRCELPSRCRADQGIAPAP